MQASLLESGGAVLVCGWRAGGIARGLPWFGCGRARAAWSAVDGRRCPGICL